MQLELFPSYDYAVYPKVGESKLERAVLDSAEELWWEWHPNYPHTKYQSTFGLGRLGAIWPENDKHIMSVGIGKKSEPMSTDELIGTAIALLVYAYGAANKGEHGT